MKRHSGPDPESINADKNRLRLRGRSDESGQITNSSFRHPELDSGSIKIGKDSGSGAGMTEPSHVHPSCHSELDSESINADNNRLRLGGRSDESGKITNSSFRHPELAAKSVERESKRDFMPLPCDSESIDEHKTFVMLNLFHHPNKILNQVQNDNADKSFVWSIIKQNIHRPAIRSDEGSRMLCTTSRHSDGNQSLLMLIDLIRHFCQQTSRKAAFTMAEVLITLSIIGIVAAMTLPSLIGKYQKKVTVTRLKRIYTVLSQAVQRSIADNGDPSGWNTESYYWSEGSQANLQKILETFSSTYIVPYLAKINRIEYASFKDLGYKQVIIPNETSTRYLDMRGQIIILNDGSIIQLRMSTSGNLGTEENRVEKYIDIMIIADINGFRGPNILGKDFFLFQIVSKTGQFRFYGMDEDKTREQVKNRCQSKPMTCGRLIMTDGWEISDDYPWW